MHGLLLINWEAWIGEETLVKKEKRSQGWKERARRWKGRTDAVDFSRPRSIKDLEEETRYPLRSGATTTYTNVTWYRIRLRFDVEYRIRANSPPPLGYYASSSYSSLLFSPPKYPLFLLQHFFFFSFVIPVILSIAALSQNFPSDHHTDWERLRNYSANFFSSSTNPRKILRVCFIFLAIFSYCFVFWRQFSLFVYCIICFRDTLRRRGMNYGRTRRKRSNTFDPHWNVLIFLFLRHPHNIV